MSQTIDLLDDFSEALVVSSAPAVSPWALPPQQQQQQQQQYQYNGSITQNNNYTPSQPAPPAPAPVQTTSQPAQQLPPKAYSSYIPSENNALVTTNTQRDTSYQLDNNQMVPYKDSNLSASGPLSTTNNEAKLSQMTNIISKHVPPNASPLPFLPIHASGYILCRISFRTLLFKKWKQCYWVLYGTSKLLIFRSKEDADDWRFNPYHTKNERDFLVRLCIDFLNDCKIIQNCRGYKISPMGHKSYGRRKEDLLYHFKLERCMDYGPVIASCFASQDKSEIDAIRKVIIHCIKHSLKELKNNNNPPNDNFHQSMPPEVFASSYNDNQQSHGQQPFGYNDDYVFDYDSGKPIPVEEFQKRRNSKKDADTTVARGRYSDK